MSHTGLGPQSRRGVWTSKDLRARGYGALTTHYMEEAEGLCDRVAIMDQGGSSSWTLPGA